jgi:hypothetical protein
MGIDPTKDLKSLVLSHHHHNHADGISHFQGTDIIVLAENHQASPGIKGSLMGAVPSQWPSWFQPRLVELSGPPANSFDRSLPLTEAGTIFCVPPLVTCPATCPSWSAPRM